MATLRIAVLRGPEALNVFAVEGNLINALDFRVKCHGDDATMGETLFTQGDDDNECDEDGMEEMGAKVAIAIRFQSPVANNNGDAVQVDHIDLIAGDITGLAAPNDAPFNPTARVLARFEPGDWKTYKDGWNEITFHTRIDGSTYFRLRGTNNAMDDTTQIDPTTADPALDPQGKAAEEAWSDLWFYSNPIFVMVN